MMNLKRLMLASAALVIPALTLLLASPSSAPLLVGTAVGTFSTVKKANDEHISIVYKDSEGATHDLSVSTGETGTSNTGDDLPKDMTGVDKAVRIKDAINAQGAAVGVVATANGGVVTVTAPGGITSFTVTNNTREKENSTKIHDPNASESVSNAEATATFVGSLAGVDDDGLPAEVSLGTNRYVVTVQTSDFVSVRAMSRSIVRQLVTNGVSASLITSSVIRIVIDEALDEKVYYGNTDVGLVQEVTFSVQ